MAEDTKLPQVLDPAAIVAGVSEAIGPKLAEMIAQAVDAKVTELGLDKIDRKHIITEETKDEPDPKKRVEKFFRGVIFGSTDPAVVKALGEATNEAGGYLVPEDFRAQIIMRVNDLTVLYPRAFKFNTGLTSVKVPTLATDVEVSWDEAQNADFDESDAAFDKKTFTIHRMNAITYSSRELLADSAINLTDLLTQLFSDAVARERDKMIVVGDGSTQPEGIFSASGVTEISTTVGSIGYADLLAMDEAIAEQYRNDPSLVWITNQTVRRYIRAIKDSAGQPLLRESLERGAPMTLMDHPILINRNVPSGQIALGVMSKYWIANREEMGVESTTTGGDTFKKHQVALKIWERWDGKLTYTTECWVKSRGITGSSAHG